MRSKALILLLICRPHPKAQARAAALPWRHCPSPDATFAAVVSQFGFEYGDVGKVAAEIARVLAPGGTVGLMVHRGDGPILEHNLARRAAIDWVLGEQKLAQVVVTALEAPNGGPQVAAQVAAAVGIVGARKFGDESPAWEIPEALRRAVLLGTQAGDAAIQATIAEIEMRAANEIGRIASLERACATADRREEIIAGFAAHDLQPLSSEDVCEPSGRALASFLTFS